MKSSWLAVTLSVAGLVLLAFFFLPGQQDNQPAGESVKTSVPKPGEANLERRLKGLRGARTHEPQGGTGSTQGKIAARSGVPAAPNLRLNPQPAVPGMQQSEQPGPPASDEDPDDIPSLTRTYQHDPDPERRLAAVTMLGASDDPQVIPVLAQALSDQDEEVRLAAVQALSDFTGEAAVDAIEPALNDPSADIRYEALEVLSDLDAERARPFVEKALNDPDEEVRTLAESLIALDDAPARAPAAPAPQGNPAAVGAPRS